MYYSLGIGTGVLLWDWLRQEIISPTWNPGQCMTRDPPAVSLFFAAATYLAPINSPSSNFDSESEYKGSGLLDSVHISQFQLPTNPTNIATIINTPTTHHIENHPISNNLNFVAAKDGYNNENKPFPQELATPLPDGCPARDHQTITTISWSDALQLQLMIGPVLTTIYLNCRTQSHGVMLYGLQLAPITALSDALNGFVHFTYDFFQGKALVCNIIKIKTINGCLTGISGLPVMRIRTELIILSWGIVVVNAAKLELANFAYPTSDDNVDSGIEVAIDPSLDTLEQALSKSSSGKPRAYV
ncbi:hypothetical protein DFH28DRAFT_1127673 [Melampsora americana]|nr:hypothetical protein DFH28DRAFT_1127673 [Melampsora americana]